MAGLNFATRALNYAKSNAPAALEAAKKLYADKGTTIEKVAAVQTSKAQGGVVEALMASGMNATMFRQAASLTDAEMSMFQALFNKYEQSMENALNSSAAPVQSSGDRDIDFIANGKDIQFVLNVLSVNPDTLLRLVETFRTLTSEKLDRFQMARRMGVRFDS